MLAHNYLRGLYLLFASCALCLMMSCQSGPDDETVPEGQCTITFSVTNYRQISFDDLSGAAKTRAMSPHEIAALKHLLVVIYNAESGQQACSPMQHNQSDYTREDQWDAYPKFSVTLPYGRYQVLVLGYNGDYKCNIASLNNIYWESDYVPNTFLYCDEFTLNEETSLNKEITLKHVVAAFRLIADDAIPAELKKMRFSSTAGGTALDATTGFTPANNGRTSDIIIPASHVGIKDTFTVYLFLPEEQTTTNYTVQALGANDALINGKHFNDVPLRINYLTEWKGKLFEASDDEPDGEKRAFYIEWDTQWAGELHIDQ